MRSTSGLKVYCQEVKINSHIIYRAFMTMFKEKKNDLIRYRNTRAV